MISDSKTLKTKEVWKLADGKFSRDEASVVIEQEMPIYVNGEHLVTASITPIMEKEFVIGYLFGQGFVDSYSDIPYRVWQRGGWSSRLRLRHLLHHLPLLQHVCREHGTAIQEGRAMAGLPLRGAGLYYTKPGSEVGAGVAGLWRHAEASLDEGTGTIAVRIITSNTAPDVSQQDTAR